MGKRVIKPCPLCGSRLRRVRRTREEYERDRSHLIPTFPFDDKLYECGKGCGYLYRVPANEGGKK